MVWIDIQKIYPLTLIFACFSSITTFYLNRTLINHFLTYISHFLPNHRQPFPRYTSLFQHY